MDSIENEKIKETQRARCPVFITSNDRGHTHTHTQQGDLINLPTKIRGGYTDRYGQIHRQTDRQTAR
jgi:hypothetical protein